MTLQMLLVNASQLFRKERPKNVLTEAGIAAVMGAFVAGETMQKLARVLTIAEARTADYNLSPSQFVEVGECKTHRPMSEILADLEHAKAERERTDAHLAGVLVRLGLLREAKV